MRMIDSHVHLENHRPELLIERADHYGYEKICVMGIPCYPQYNNRLNALECLVMKRLAPERIYAFNSMAFFDTLTPTAKTHEKQLELLMEAGCDGWKLIESKPSTYRDLQIPMDGEIYSRAFAMAERENIPIKWHAGDPAIFWDEKKAPPIAKSRGWLCTGPGFPTLEKIYSEVENVLARHPKLNVAMAHLYFISDDRPHGERLLDVYENFLLDITPGTEMYDAFLADREGWKAFFEKYQDKLEFGTDMTDVPMETIRERGDFRNEMIWEVMSENGPVDRMGRKGTGLGLSQAALDKIFAGNFEKRVGPKPRPLSESGVNAYAEWLMPYLTPAERKTAEDLLRR